VVRRRRAAVEANRLNDLETVLMVPLDQANMLRTPRRHSSRHRDIRSKLIAQELSMIAITAFGELDFYPDSQADNMCSICMDPLTAMRSTITPCSHIIHRDCLQQYMAHTLRTSNEVKCPLCRSSLPLCAIERMLDTPMGTPGSPEDGMPALPLVVPMPFAPGNDTPPDEPVTQPTGAVHVVPVPMVALIAVPPPAAVPMQPDPNGPPQRRALPHPPTGDQVRDMYWNVL